MQFVIDLDDLDVACKEASRVILRGLGGLRPGHPDHDSFVEEGARIIRREIRCRAEINEEAGPTGREPGGPAGR